MMMTDVRRELLSAKKVLFENLLRKYPCLVTVLGPILKGVPPQVDGKNYSVEGIGSEVPGSHGREEIVIFLVVSLGEGSESVKVGDGVMVKTAISDITRPLLKIVRVKAVKWPNGDVKSVLVTAYDPMTTVAKKKAGLTSGAFRRVHVERGGADHSAA